jgi:hypothetical protein
MEDGLPSDVVHGFHRDNLREPLGVDQGKVPGFQQSLLPCFIDKGAPALDHIIHVKDKLIHQPEEKFA